ncbi:hypothetical protein HELRODRAFT_181938 [Helobdella robusta]|uniref:Uncharacterized protein n=1 Tax=Helobdella robusta TaxID=6412 RepID=T1FHH3_HELRO|nr:hypothetical protein HELRODRAFT_181938 [Helobdella robusta]ESN92009.1 hypothetical protein HELRODRAFT_181938 [Helobdella robusta]
MIAIEGIPPSMYNGMETFNVSTSTTGHHAATGPGGIGLIGANNRRPMNESSHPHSNTHPHFHQNNISAQQQQLLQQQQHEATTSGGWSQKLKHRKEYTVLKKVVRVLQDNRDTDNEASQRLHRHNNNNGNGDNDAACVVASFDYPTK